MTVVGVEGMTVAAAIALIVMPVGFVLGMIMTTKKSVKTVTLTLSQVETIVQSGWRAAMQDFYDLDIATSDILRFYKSMLESKCESATTIHGKNEFEKYLNNT